MFGASSELASVMEFGFYTQYKWQMAIANAYNIQTRQQLSKKTCYPLNIHRNYAKS